MATDNIDKLYDALKADGILDKDRQTFRDYMLAPGQQGYKNRVAIYNTLKADEYVNSATYEDFSKALGLTGSPKPASTPASAKQQPPAQPSSAAASAQIKRTAATQMQNPVHQVKTAPATAPDKAEAVREDKQEPMMGLSQKKEAWQPSVHDRIRMLHDIRRNRDIASRRTRDMLEQTGRVRGQMMQEGRDRAKTAEFQARSAGVYAKPLGLSSPYVSSATASAQVESGAGREGKRMVSPVPYGVSMVDGKPEVEWLLPDGRVTTDFAEADQTEFGARGTRLRDQFVGRMRENGLDPAKEQDVNQQAWLDRQEPIRKVLEPIWAKAEAEDKAADEQYAREVAEYSRSMRSNMRAMGADGMPVQQGEEYMRDLDRSVKRKETFDLEKMADRIYDGLPETYKQESLRMYERYYSNPAHAEELKGRTVRAAAEGALRSDVYATVYERAVDAQMPEGKSEFLLRKITDQPFLSQAWWQDKIASQQTGSWGMASADVTAMGRYGEAHRALDITGTVLNMAVDPTTYMSGFVGGKVAKGAMRMAGKRMVKDATGEVAERLAGRTLAGRLAGGMSGGAGNFMTFEMIKGAQNQVAQGGYINPETGENEGYSMGQILWNGVHGFAVGAATGAVSPMLGNVSDKLVKASTSTGAKAGIRVGELAASTVAEGTIFSIPDWISDDRGDAWDVWTDNMAMMLGFKASHMVKSAPRVLAEMKGDGKHSFRETLRNKLDSSPSDAAMTKEDLEELRRTGYGTLADLFGKKDRTVKMHDGDGKWMAYGETEIGKARYGADSENAEEFRETPEFDGYDNMAELMKDGRVSEAVRAKAYYILTGRMLPMSAITGYDSYTSEEDGSVTVRSMNAQGEVVTSKRFKSKTAARQHITDLDRQMELNAVDAGEKYRTHATLQKATQAAYEDVAAMHGEGWTAEGVAKAYDQAVKDQESGKEVGQDSKALVDEVDAAMERHIGDYQDETSEAIRKDVNDLYGVDLDKALKKPKGDRTLEERNAVEDYLERLYPEEVREDRDERNKTKGDREAEAAHDAGYNMTDDGDREEAMREYRYQQRRMREKFGLDDPDEMLQEELGMLGTSDTASSLDALEGSRFDAEERAVISDYLKSREKIWSVTDRMNDDLADKICKETEFIGKTAHEDGNIRPATMKAGERQVYIIKGNVEVTDDGMINTAKSDDVIYVYDPETDKVEQTSPILLGKLGDVTDAEEARQEMERMLRSEDEAYRRRASGYVDSFNPGDRFTVDLGEGYGGPQEITVTGLDGEGEVVFEMEGESYQAPADYLSERIDAYRQMEYESRYSPAADPTQASGEAQKENWLVRYGEPGNAETGRPTASGVEPGPQVPVGMPYEQGDEMRVVVSGSDKTQHAAVVDHEGATVVIWSPFAVNDRSEKSRTMSGYTTELTEAELDGLLERDAEGQPVGYMGQSQDQTTEAESGSETATTDEETVIHGGIEGTGEGLKEAFAEERERIGNEWLDDQGVQDALRAYAEGAGDIEELVERAKADSGDERTRQRLDTLLEFDSTRKKLEGILKGPNDENRETPENPVESGEATIEPMPMRTVTENGETWEEPDYLATTPERSHTYIYNESGLSRKEADEHVEFMAKQARAAVEKHAKKEPKIGGSIGKYRLDHGKWEQAGAELQRTVEFWDAVKSEQKKVIDAERAVEEARKAEERAEAIARMNEENRIRKEKEEEYLRHLAARRAEREAEEKTRQEEEARAKAERESRMTTEQLAEEAERMAAEEAERKALMKVNKDFGEIHDKIKDMPAAVERLQQLEPETMHEAAAVVLSGGRILWSDDGGSRGMKQESGYGEGERRKLFGLFTTKEKGGRSLRKMSEDEMKEVCDQYGIQYDNTEAMNALIDVLSQARVPSDIRNYIKNRRMEQALAMYEQEEAHERALYAEWCQEAFGMSIEDYEAREENMLAEAEKAYENFDETEYFGNIADEIKSREYGIREHEGQESEGEGARYGGGGEVLSAQGVDTTEGTGADARGQGVPEGDGDQVGDPARSVSEGASGGEVAPGRRYDRTVPATREEQRGAIARIIDFAKRVKNRVERAVIGGITKRQARDFAEQGIEVDETWVHSFESSAVSHNQKHHGSQGAEDARGQVAITADDYSRIPDILDGYDRVSKSANRTKGTENEVIIYEKEFEDGYVYYLEEKRDSRKSLAFHTMYKKKKGTDSSDGFAVDSTAPITPIATPDNLDSKSDGKDNTLSPDKQGNSGESSVQAAVAAASAEVNTEPTDGQKEAGNYRMGHVEIDGLRISIENPKGSVRRGTDADGKAWETEMRNTYGYIRGTTGKDGDKIDVFLSDTPDRGDVYVVDQYNKDGSFDEHKVMYGFESADAAMAAFRSNYSAEWTEGRRLEVTGVTREEFRKWLDASDRKVKAFAEYRSVKRITEDVDQTRTNVNDDGLIVDSDGKALTLYHGTPNGVASLGDLEPGHARKGIDEGPARFNGDGISFTPHRDVAEDYAADGHGNPGRVFAANIRLKNPYYTVGVANFTPEEAAEFTGRLKVAGHDGIINYQSEAMRAEGALPNEVIVFDIKSAEEPAGNPDESGEQGTKMEPEAGYELDEYTMKRGKKYQRVKFPRADKELWKERLEIAKEQFGGTSVPGGYGFKDAETARAFADYILHPVSAEGLKEHTGPARAAEEAQTESEKPENRDEAAEKEARSRWFNEEDQEEAAELIRKMKARLKGGNMYSGVPIDVELLEMGCRLGYLIMKKGARKLQEYARAMIESLGDGIRPYVKQFYNATLATEEALEQEWYKDATPMAEIAKFDMVNFLKEGRKDIVETAKGLTEEQDVKGAMPAAATGMVKSVRNSDGSKSETYVEGDHEVTVTTGDFIPGVKVENGKAEWAGPMEDATQGAVDALTGGKGKKKVKKPEQGPAMTGNLFDQIETEDEKETDVQPGAEDAGRGRQQPRPDDQVGAGAEHEDERPDGGGMAGRDGVHTVPDTGRGAGVSGLHPGKRGIEESGGQGDKAGAKPKNDRNYHAERGKDYAPKGEKARIDANIAAIELAKELLGKGATASPQEMSVLRRYSGWGGLGAAFNEGSAWAPNPINKRLREILTPEEYDAAVMSRNSAYYTPAYVIDSMWDIAKALGFNGGKVLEGSAGIGNIIGQMPTDISERSDIHAVEIDPTTGGILSLLYPDAQVDVQGFERTRIANGSVDLAITNVPFVTDLHVKDESGDGDLSKKFRDIHDFCIAKNVRKLREGGIGIFITSSGTLDKSQKLRNWLVGEKEGNVDVVGAFRMNNQTFGGTPATSDIIVVRKRVNGRKSVNAIDVSTVTPARTATYRDEQGKATDLPLFVNRYFIEHPEHMGGEMAFNFERGVTYRPTSFGLFPTGGADQGERMSAWVQHLADMDWSKEQKQGAAEAASQNQTSPLGEGVKEGSMVTDSEGNLCVARMGRAVPLTLNKNKIKGRTKEECFKDYAAIKTALADVLKYQTEHDDDAGLRPLLDRLNRAYDTFVERYGNLNKNSNLAWLRNDVDFSSIIALETYSEKGNKDGTKVKTYGKTDIFSRRVVEKESEPSPKNVKDGIIASIYKYGRIDTEYLATQLGKPQEDVKREIVESGLGYEDPTTGQMEVSYEYLSGNVREKLRQAREANESAGGAYDANIKVLEAVVPMNIPAHLIDFSLGSSWVDPSLYERYVKERTELDVSLVNADGTWYMRLPYFKTTEKNKAMGVVSTLCDKTITGDELIYAAMTNRSIVVSKTIKDSTGTETITDNAASTACAAKVDEIRQDFKDWAHEQMQNDPELAMRIEEQYNEKFNNSVPTSIPDEFVPEHFGGAATTVGGRPFNLRPHQAKAVIRATTQPVLLAHEVGTGKTYTLITTAMEMRRLGTARKPMIVVQNATVGQFVASAKTLYPNAKVLTLEDADRTADGRMSFYAKIKFNDWDMIVVPQSVFERIPDSIERQTQFIQDKIAEKMLVLDKMRDDDPDGRSMIVRAAEREIKNLQEEVRQLAIGAQAAAKGKKKERDAKKAAVARQNAEVKAKEMLDRATDDVEDFDSMGIDAILVDEAHEYKHLGFATAMQRGVKGIDPSYSKKSQGVFLKVQAVMEKTGGKNVVFATGTPISNTAAEIWTFMRYLMPADVMKDYHIYYFDDFVRNFGSLQQMLEFKTNGKYDEVNRFAGYMNLPELVRIWSGVADTVLTREAGGVSDKIPQMEGGKAQDIFLPQTRALRSIMKYVKDELEKYEKMTGKQKKENSHIPLVMYGIAKAAAVDARLVQSDADDDPNSKTNEAVRQTLRTLEETKDYNGTVAIFADNYQNKASGFNLYEDIRKKLIAAGVPEEQVVVMKSGMSVKKKLEIFDRVNSGEVRVVMGSTFTLGTGVNIQERLHTLIHLDAPNRPMDYTQRNGRILRQGNLHNTWGLPVRVLRFGVEDSLDVTAYQRLKTKGAIADSIMNGKHLMENSMENRSLEEDQDLFGDITAQLSGSEYAMLKNQIEKEVRKLRAAEKNWKADQAYIHNRKRQIAWQDKESERRIAENREYLEKVESATIGDITVGKRLYHTVDAMEEFFTEQNKKKAAMQEEVRKLAYSSRPVTSDITISVGGFDFDIHTEINKETKQGQDGDLFSSAPAKMTYSCPELGIEKMPVSGNLIKNAVRDIMENVVSGKDFRERIEIAERSMVRNAADLATISAREGVSFQFADELAKAEEKLAEYEELMKAEMAAKEAKYAEMDKDVEAASGIELTEDEDGNVAEAPGGDKKDGPAVAEEPAAGYTRRGSGTVTGQSLFDWADGEQRRTAGRERNLFEWADSEGRTSAAKAGARREERETREKREMRAQEQAAAKADAAIDRYTDEFGEYLKRAGELEEQLEAEGADDELRGAIAEQMEADEDRLHGLREELRASLREYYGRNNTAEDAERIARDMTGRVEAEVSAWQNRHRLLEDVLTKLGADRNADATVETDEAEARRDDKRHPGRTAAVRNAGEAKPSDGEVRTGGGVIRYEAQGHLPDVTAGEFAYVERQFSRSGEFGFTGSERIRDRGDVAYLFRALEDYSVEHMLVALVKDGRVTVLHIGMGTPTMTAGDLSAIIAGVDAFGADKIYLVHNHPSGTMVASVEDQRLMARVEDSFKGRVETEGMIMDTTSGRYVTYDGKGNQEVHERPRAANADEAEAEREDRRHPARTPGAEESSGAGRMPAAVYRLDKAVRRGMPRNPEKVMDSSGLNKYLTGLRFGDGRKLSYLVLSNGNEIIGNFHTDYEDVKDPGLVEEITSVATKYGGRSVVMYGNMELKGLRELGTALTRRSMYTVRLLDALSVRNGIGRSARDEGVLEPGAPYETLRAEEPRRTEVADGLRRMTLEEQTLRLSVMMADRHAEDVAMRDAAVEALGKTLGNIRKTMAAQRKYDQGTIQNLRNVAEILMESGQLRPEGTGEVKRLLGLLSQSVGTEREYENAAESLLDMFVTNQLRLSGQFLDDVLKMRGSKENARGVEVAGKLDAEGQLMLRGLKGCMGLSVAAIRERMAALDEKLASGSEAASMEAGAEKIGLRLAEQYAEEVADRYEQEKQVKAELEELKGTWDAHKSGTERQAYVEQKRALRETVRKLRIERAEAMRQLASQVGNELRNSVERVKAFHELERQRVAEIHHNANSDMTGRAYDEHGMKKKGLGVRLSNNMVSRLLLAPAATFEQMMRVFGKKSVDGEGYQYDRYVRGWQECRDREWIETQRSEGHLNRKAAEILCKRKARWSDLYGLTRKSGGAVKWWDGGEMRSHEVTQGNLMYMYMVNKMTDGQVKLRRMGITDEKMDEVTAALDPKLKAVADWLQEDLLPRLRETYNAVHMRMFGAPMAEIENYFPLRILVNARLQEVEITENMDGNELPKTMTGALVKRRFNLYALDILNSDGVSVALDHIREMETWAAFAEYRRDLGTLLSYKHFRNQVKNMTTIYGSGEKLWQNFYKLALLVGGAYQPKVSEFDKTAVNLTKLATGACIAIRLNTALKQLLSYPAFAPDANLARLMYNLTPWRARACWKWAMENMPAFQRRWQSRQAGNDVLKEWKHDWDWTRTDFVQKIQRFGITPNAFIDALTVAMGSEAVYHNKLKGYLKDGFSKEEAHRRAIQDAEIIFNLSQQSSELPYLSLLQNDRSYLTTCITNFRNSPMSYLRQSIQSKRELLSMMKGKEIQIEFETKKGVREGLTPEQAKARAERKYKRNWVRNLFKSANFDYILPALWAFGLSGMWYCIFGKDDEKKKQYAEDAMKRGMLGGLEGFTFGGTMPDFMYGLATGDKPQLDEETSPAMGLLTEMANLYSNGKTERAANEMINTMVALGVGVNPQVLEDGVVAGMDFFGEDEKSARDWALLFMRVIQCPQSQMDQVYFDELGMDAREAQGKSPAELAERYATYKGRRANFATMWAYDDQRWESEVKAPWRKRFEKEAKERLKSQSESGVNERLEQYDAESKDVKKRLDALTKERIPILEKAAKAAEIQESPEGRRYRLYEAFGGYLDRMTKSWLKAESAEAAAREAAGIIEYKEDLVRMLDSWEDPGKSRAARKEAIRKVQEYERRQAGHTSASGPTRAAAEAQ